MSDCAMTRNGETRPDPLKPTLFRPNPVERLRPAPAHADRAPPIEPIGPYRWECVGTTESKPPRIWLPTETISRLSTHHRTMRGILVVTGDPGANGNRFDREIAHMRAALTGIPMTERVSISAHELAACLRPDPPTILHICAHASDELLALHVDGRINWAPFAVLADILLRLPAPRLLVLNVCNCGTLADLLATWATTTVYWADPIDDDTARSFSSPFYEALLGGESVSDAVAIARADTPQLLGQTPRVNGNRDLILTPWAEAE